VSALIDASSDINICKVDRSAEPIQRYGTVLIRNIRRASQCLFLMNSQTYPDIKNCVRGKMSEMLAKHKHGTGTIDVRGSESCVITWVSEQARKRKSGKKWCPRRACCWYWYGWMPTRPHVYTMIQITLSADHNYK
jgi:hypothetical protein